MNGAPKTLPAGTIQKLSLDVLLGVPTWQKRRAANRRSGGGILVYDIEFIRQINRHTRCLDGFRIRDSDGAIVHEYLEPERA